MTGIARIGDPISCGDTIAVGSGNVFVNSIPVTRLGDTTTGHTPPGHTFFPPTTINSGSGSVFVNSIPVARCDDSIIPHTDSPHDSAHTHGGSISACSPDVFADS